MNNVLDKTIIEEAALELGIDPAFIEKDWYVVQLIREITNSEIRFHSISYGRFF